MDLAGLIKSNGVKIPLEAYDKEEALAELLELLVRRCCVKDRDGVLEALCAREAKGTTGIGGGVAIPHAKSLDVQGVEIAVGVSPDGIEFDAADGAPVYVVFLVVAEAHNPGPNVESLAHIGHLMQFPGIIERMRGAGGADEIVRIVDQAWDEQT